MSTVLTPRRARQRREPDRDAGRFARQESLFGAYAAPPAAASAPAEAVAEPIVAEPVVAAAVTAPIAPEPETRPAEAAALHGPTLDEAITALWNDLRGGDAVACPVCGTEAMQPRHSAGAGVVGGRCGACDSTLS
jgi:hypothetical protein